MIDTCRFCGAAAVTPPGEGAGRWYECDSWVSSDEHEQGDTCRIAELDRQATHLRSIVDRLRDEMAKWSEPDMWWDADNPEHCTIDEPSQLADDLEIGTVFECLAARQLPNRFYRVVAGKDNDGEFSDEYLDVQEISRAAYKAAEAAKEGE